MLTIQSPWAILLCKFKDDPNDPDTITIADLASQNPVEFESSHGVIDQAVFTDTRTIIDLYTMFFTSAGSGTNNMVNYWHDASNGGLDLSGSQVFKCTLPMTIKEGAALATSPGGSKYQNLIFQKAKAVLQQQYGVNPTSFYGIVVSFQSPDFGSQGGWYDGSPGVYMDIRFIRVWGSESWGHEMGHAYGLDHSRTNGEPGGPEGPTNPDYTDPWDIMSARNVFSFFDANYEKSGPGLNAWNMRCRGWLDENRIRKIQPSKEYSETVQLRPLHRPDLPGFIGAELPGIGLDGPYLVEFRMRAGWDSGIPTSAVIVHRFEGSVGAPFTGAFLGNSYVMKGTANQKALSSGDVFQSGAGPFSRVRVLSIDDVNMMATVQLCYSNSPATEPSVKIIFIDNYGGTCPVFTPVQGTTSIFSYELTLPTCGSSYKVTWSASIGLIPLGEATNGKTFSINVPNSPVQVWVSISVFFDDGTIVKNTYPFNPIPAYEADFGIFACKIRQRFRPIPWWEWDPERIQNVANKFSKGELDLIERRTEVLLQTIRRLRELSR